MVEKKKQCSKCKKRKSLSEFYKEKHGKYGVGGNCKKCDIIRAQKYYQVHKTKQIKRHKEYRQTFIGHLRCLFQDMKQRCNNPAKRNICYRNVKCLFKNADEFVNYVINKLQIDSRGLTIDRIDNNGHYEPGNIRFVTNAENQKNKRR